MLTPNDIGSAREHFDVVAVLFFITAAGLLGVCIYIINQHNKNDDKTVAVLEKHSADIIKLQEQAKQIDKTEKDVDQHTTNIARLFTGLGKMMTAYNSKHPGEKLEL